MKVLHRFMEVLGIFAIGDGALSVAAPRGHTALWRVGPRPWRRTMARLHRRPRLTRAIGLTEVAVGILLVSLVLRR
jgi:uncharacterized protein YjeT (DUF2065 family)